MRHGRDIRIYFVNAHTMVYLSGCNCKTFIWSWRFHEDLGRCIAARGSLMSKSHEMAYELLEEMATNAYQWLTKKSMPNKVMQVHEVDAFFALSA